jgi:hypothetical protein
VYEWGGEFVGDGVWGWTCRVREWVGDRVREGM